MNKYKISEEEFHKVSLTRLANNPSSQSRYSGARLSAEELKERMDEPLKLFKGKLNAVVSLIFGEGDDSALDHMPTGIKEGHTLAQMIKDVVSTSAEFAGYLSVGEKTLLKKLEEIDKAFEDINKALEKKVDKKTYEDAIKQCLKRIDGEAGIEYAYAQRDGEGRLKPMSLSPTAESIALRGEGGRLKAGSPVEDDDVVTKEYADKTHYGASQIFASALKGFASGEAVALKDVSPLEHNLGVRVESKNLLDYTNFYTDFGSEVGYTLNEDKTLSFSGTASGLFQYNFFYDSNNPIVCTEDMFVSGCPSGGAFETYCLQAFVILPNGTETYLTEYGDGMVVSKGSKIKRIFAIIRAGANVDGLTFEPMLVKGTKKTTYAPYMTDTSGVKLKVCGENLFDVYSITDCIKMSNSLSVGGTIRADDVLYNPCGSYGDGTYFTGFSMYLKQGWYHISADVFATSPETGSGAARLYNPDTKTYSGSPAHKSYALNAWTHYDWRVSIETANEYYLSLSAGGNASNYNNLDIRFKNIMITPEVVRDEYPPYVPYVTTGEHTQGEDIKSIAPCTTLMTDTEGALITVEYNKDINKAFEELMNLILSLGGNVYD